MSSSFACRFLKEHTKNNAKLETHVLAHTALKVTNVLAFLGYLCPGSCQLTVKEVIEMPIALKEMDRVDLINIERLAHILKGLSPIEFETLEVLLDDEASKTINQSLKELEASKRIPIDEW